MKRMLLTFTACMLVALGGAQLVSYVAETSRPAYAQFVDQRTWGGTSGGSANAQTISIANYNNYVAGVPLRFLAGFSNTAATTFNVSSIGLRNVYRQTEDEVIPTVGGEIVAGAVVTVTYDGAKFVIEQRQVPIGTVLDYGGVAAPPGYVFAGGQDLTRSAPYDALFRKTTIRQNGTTSSGSPIITALSDTSNMAVGMPVCGTGIATNSVISSVDSGTQITLSLNATGSATVTVTVAPNGCGDGSTTFTVADGRGGVFPGRDNMISAASRITFAGTSCRGATLGFKCGQQSTTLVKENIPQMTAGNGGLVDPGHSHTGTWYYNTGGGNVGGGVALAVNLLTQSVSTSTTGITVGYSSPTTQPRLMPLQVVNKIVKY